MTQDTRKDPRAKIVSLNVRYKSATVDEFIENHSHDVSKGGIFIKTSTPFPQGTLLKFEIRLAGDQAVIAGVGRVVWKREPTHAGGVERPAGMGVKFIKIDESSRAVIDRLVGAKEGAGSAFTSELKESGAPRSDKATPPGGLTAGSASAPPRPGKSTLLGVGVAGSVPPAGTPSSAPKAGSTTLPGGAAAGGFFPKTNSEEEMPAPAERTMMKQAAELLEEALKGAGGSMEEVGQNPLFSGENASSDKPTAPPPPGLSPAEADAAASVPPAPKAESPQAAPEARPAPPPPPPAPAKAASERPVPVASAVAALESGSNAAASAKKPNYFLWIAAVVALGGIAVFFAKPELFGRGGPSPAESVTPTDTAPSASATEPVTPPAPADSTEVAAVADAAATAIHQAADAAVADAHAAVATTAVADASPSPKPTATAPKPRPKPTATATATSEPSETPSPSPSTTSTEGSGSSTTEKPEKIEKPKPEPDDTENTDTSE